MIVKIPLAGEEFSPKERDPDVPEEWAEPDVLLYIIYNC
jgi:hypothetical protein